MERGQAGGVIWTDDKHCFVCGERNEQGLKLAFTLDGEKLKTSWRAEKRFQGYADILHGGIISVVLDETMVNLPWKLRNAPVVSAELNVRFLKACKVGDLLHFTSWAEEEGRRLWRLAGECRRSDGDLIATATCRAVPMKIPTSGE